jgi:hypothetical protein
LKQVSQIVLTLLNKQLNHQKLHRLFLRYHLRSQLWNNLPFHHLLNRRLKSSICLKTTSTATPRSNLSPNSCKSASKSNSLSKSASRQTPFPVKTTKPSLLARASPSTHRNRAIRLNYRMRTTPKASSKALFATISSTRPRAASNPKTDLVASPSEPKSPTKSSAKPVIGKWISSAA